MHDAPRRVRSRRMFVGAAVIAAMAIGGTAIAEVNRAEFSGG